MINNNLLKNSIFYALFIFFVVLILPGSYVQQPGEFQCEKVSHNLTGRWEWDNNNEHQSFSIIITQVSNMLKLQVCAISNDGARVDCVAGDDFSSVIPITRNYNVIAKVKSAYTGNTCIVRLTFKKDKLLWKIVKAPKGDCYFPKNAIMKKASD